MIKGPHEQQSLERAVLVDELDARQPPCVSNGSICREAGRWETIDQPERKANKRPLPTDCQPAIMIRSAALLLQRSCLSASQTQKNEDSLIDACHVISPEFPDTAT